jgi:hypothetical protein
MLHRRNIYAREFSTGGAHHSKFPYDAPGAESDFAPGCENLTVSNRLQSMSRNQDCCRPAVRLWRWRNTTARKREYAAPLSLTVLNSPATF